MKNTRIQFISLCQQKCEFHDEWTVREKFIWGSIYYKMGLQSRHKSWKRAPVERKQWLVIRHNAACLAVWAMQDENAPGEERKKGKHS